MARKPPKQTCNKAGCPGLVDPDVGRCPECGVYLNRRGWKDNRKLSSTQRGYGADWERVRKRKLSCDPWCEDCLTKRTETKAIEVHHLTPFDGKDDPMRLAWENLRSLCGDCHRTATGKR